MSDVYTKKAISQTKQQLIHQNIGYLRDEANCVWEREKEREDAKKTYDLDFLYNDFSADVFTLRPTKFSLSDASFCNTFNVFRILLMFSWSNSTQKFTKIEVKFESFVEKLVREMSMPARDRVLFVDSQYLYCSTASKSIRILILT